jgi:hypothetical protein
MQMKEAEASFQIQKDLIDQKEALSLEQFQKGLINEQQYNEALKGYSEARMEIDQKENEAKMANAAMAAGLLGTVSDLVGRNTAAGKATAIAATTIDTYLGAQKAYTSQLIPGDPSSPIRAAIAAAIAVAGGIKNVREIVKTKVPGGGAASAPSTDMEKKLPLYEMMIGDTIEGEEEVDFIALVEYPAIQKNFLAFSQDFQEDSYNDYPQSAKDNAERGIRLNEAIGNRCATQVGKVRATQIMAGENLSRETIRRTYSYLSRAAEYYNPEDTEACGTISYLLWGGEPMLRWAESKMNQEDFLAVGFNKFSIENQDQRIVTGPLMVADLPIYRRDQDEEYYVSFSAAEIKKIVQRFFKKGYQSKVNVEHSTPVDGVFMFESYIIDREKGIMPPKGFEDISNGSWFGSFKVDNEKIWNEVKAGTFKGFSVEGLFRYEKTNKVVTQDEQIMQQIFKILSKIEH